jgi:hypothetical protein
MVDTVGALHAWLGELLDAHPHLKDCIVFALDGDNLNEDRHFLWCTEGGDQVEPESATEVTLYTRDLPYEPTPDEKALREREYLVAVAEDAVQRKIEEMAAIGRTLVRPERR